MDFLKKIDQDHLMDQQKKTMIQILNLDVNVSYYKMKIMIGFRLWIFGFFRWIRFQTWINLDLFHKKIQKNQT